ncbi:AraC family transcriptional regulator [Lentisalinibacter salinarum]|uniref:AraC family transcriptional regulator n=1 Tax=Lentisalinibacter salinarum TaxID=2992239 RepID=UPI00386A7C25
MRRLLFPLLLLVITGINAHVLSADAADAADAADTGDEQEFRSLDQQVQSLKKEVLDLNRELFLLEEDLLFPANSQVAMFVSLDVGTFFEVESVSLEVNGKEVANYLYTEREAEALRRGGVHRIHVGNLKVGEHELVAFFSGKGPHGRDYRRGADLVFEKGIGAKYMELKISDRQHKQQPEFVVAEWE